MKPAVYDAFGPPPTALAPSVPVRRWDEAAWAGLLAALGTYFLLAWALSTSTVSMWEIIRAGLYWREIATVPASLSVRAVSVLVCSVLIGSWMFTLGLRPQLRMRHVSGPRLLEGHEADVAARQAAKSEAGGGLPAFLSLHPALALPKTRWTRHMLIYGSVGSGKTQILLPIIEQAFARHLKLFLYDVKGDFTAKFPSAALVSPWDARSAIWDIGADVRTASDAATFAYTLIPADAEGGGNRYFSLAAQQLLLGAVLSLQQDKGKRWGWQDLADRVNAERGAFASLLKEHYPKAAPLIADEDAQATSGVLATLAAHTKVIDDLALAWGETQGRSFVSLRRWVRDGFQGKKQLIVQAGPDAVLTSAYVGAMVRLLEQMVISPAFPDDEQGRTLMVVVDELPSLRVDISALIDKGRSKGVCVVVGLQDFAQLRDAIGPNKAAALASMVGTHIVCRVQMGESRDQIAALFGRERIATTATSTGSSTGGASSTLAVHEETRAVVDPSVLSGGLGIQQGKRRTWPHGFAVRAIVSLGGDALMLDFPGSVLPNRRRSFVPAAWTKPSLAKREPRHGGRSSTPPSVAHSLNPHHAAALSALAARFGKPGGQDLQGPLPRRANHVSPQRAMDP